MQFDILTLFPPVFTPYFNESVLRRGQLKGLIKIKVHNLRDYTQDKHKTVDDRPYGGGPGMILKIEPIWQCLREIEKKSVHRKKNKNSKIILLDPAGRQFDQKMAERFSRLSQMILICGRYEGIDARVNKLVDEKISIGPYVLSGGELPAMIIIEAVTRLIPGVLGHEHSNKDETFSPSRDYVEYPQYTRPEFFAYKEKNKTKKLKVPKILLSGNHQKIKEWRLRHKK